MPDKEIDKFQTSLREVFYFIKYSKNLQMLLEKLTSSPRYHKLEKQAVMVINAITDAKLPFNEKEEVIDMCKAINDLKKQERDKSTLKFIKTLMQNTGWSTEQAMNALGISESERTHYLNMLTSGK